MLSWFGWKMKETMRSPTRSGIHNALPTTGFIHNNLTKWTRWVSSLMIRPMTEDLHKERHRYRQTRTGGPYDSSSWRSLTDSVLDFNSSSEEPASLSMSCVFNRWCEQRDRKTQTSTSEPSGTFGMSDWNKYCAEIITFPSSQILDIRGSLYTLMTSHVALAT